MRYTVNNIANSWRSTLERNFSCTTTVFKFAMIVVAGDISVGTEQMRDDVSSRILENADILALFSRAYFLFVYE